MRGIWRIIDDALDTQRAPKGLACKPLPLWQESGMIRLALLFGLFLHIGVAVWNGFYGPSFGAEGDALAFHEEALYYSQHPSDFQYVTGWVYSYFLGLLYSIFSDHIFFGSMISVGAWLWSTMIFIKIFEYMKTPRSKIALAVLIYSMWPVVLLNTSVTLRESFQALSVSMILFSAIMIIFEDKNRFFTLISGIILGSVLHGALLAYSAMMLILIGFSVTRYRLNFSSTTQLMIFIPIGAIIAFLAFGVFGNIAYNIDDGLIGAVQNYNEGAILSNGRADYRAEISLSGNLGFFLFIFSAFFQYMLEPLPRNIGSFADLALFLENVSRVFLLGYAVYGLRLVSGKSRSIIAFSFIAYLALEFIWSIGTVNWGTASRHHVPALGVLLVAALSARRGYTRSRSRPVKKLYDRNSARPHGLVLPPRV
jgi:hypothetical protein